MVKFALATVAAATLATLTAALPLGDAAGANQLTFSSGASSPASSLVDTLGLAETLAALPKCHSARLAKYIAGLPERRLVKLSEDGAPFEITEGEKALLVLSGQAFMDVTDEDQALTVAVAEKKSFPDKLTYSTKDLQPLFDHISLDKMKEFLTAFTGFRTRHYRSDTGKQSQQFLLSKIKQMAKSNKKLDIKVSEFEHPWGQNSLIARFEPAANGTASLAKEPVLIISAHQDSTNLLPFLAAPGADDDGSGTTSILAAFASLVKSGFVPSSRPVEFHWYSAEEGGLLGSQAVAQDYARRGVKVHAALQNDMTAWVKAGTEPTIGLIRDFVDPDFVELVAKLIDEYATIGRTDTKCGYACSDHASWSKVGAPSAFLIESTFEDSSKNIHSTRDTIDYSPTEFSFDHMKEFSRLAIGLAVEIGGGKNLLA
ncbi:hypothetical protein JCM10207_006694 [Rhodosporidiobolus poonsookiae]